MIYIPSEDINISISALMIIVLIVLLYRVLNKPAPGVISGTTQYNGAPVSNVDIRVYNTNGDEVGVATSDTNGAYTLPPLTFGKYHITAILKNPDGSWLQADVDVDLESATLVVDLTLEYIIAQETKREQLLTDFYTVFINHNVYIQS